MIEFPVILLPALEGVAVAWDGSVAIGCTGLDAGLQSILGAVRVPSEATLLGVVQPVWAGSVHTGFRFVVWDIRGAEWDAWHYGRRLEWLKEQRAPWVAVCFKKCNDSADLRAAVDRWSGDRLLLRNCHTGAKTHLTNRLLCSIL